ncbi:MAG: ATP-dependent Clp protease ATP-binding subunit [Treponema sp.]|nr:ATP-dependent Clp protease ATP-binding subunit [Treponema sp.]
MKNFSPRAKEIIAVLAQDEARKLGSKQLLPEHVILALIKKQDGLGYLIFNSLMLDPIELQRIIEKFFENEPKIPTLEKLPLSHRYQQLLDIAGIESNALHNDYIGTEHLLLAAIREEGSITARFFNAADYTMADVRYMVQDLQNEKNSSMRQKQAENLVDTVFKSLFSDEYASEFFGPNDKKSDNFQKKQNQNNQTNTDKSQQKKKDLFLMEFCRDLTKMAREGKLDPVVGRSKEIHRIIQILSRRNKNNPVLTGEPGVGKTAIVEGLAEKIAEGKVPSELLKKRILSLDLASVVAGTKYRGEFEERMKKILNELQENKDIILFIDELHAIIGAGGNEGTMDASNIMKPSLSRGEIQIIGATTTKEYTKHIERDMALERRFQVVKVEEPDCSDAEEILEGVKSQYEKYHNVVYSDDVIPSIVRLSKRYLPEKVLPDKAIDILDEAGAAKKIQEEERPSELAELEKMKQELEEEKRILIEDQDYEKAAYIRDRVIELRKKLTLYSDYIEKNRVSKSKLVTAADVEKIISDITGIPLHEMSLSETERMIKMEDELHNTIIGQNDAVRIISDAIRRSRAGISSPKHPVGSFIFLGPTGVGKTQLAKALSKYLFGTEDSLIRIDMSDFMEKHTASRLVGAPPGYVGYEEGGVLTEKVRRHPYSVVLLDEIEKAHPDIFNLLLQLLEEGELSDNLGHTVNFRNTVIIMTSNAGARQITNEGRVGFGTLEGVMPYEEIKASAMNELKKLLNPELLNRIDDVIIFDALSKKEISKIAGLQIEELAQRLAEKKLTISVKKKAMEYLIENGYNPSMGARPMKRLIRKEIEDPLAMAILTNKNKDNDLVVVECVKNKLKVRLKSSKTETKEKQSVQVTEPANKRRR